MIVYIPNQLVASLTSALARGAALTDDESDAVRHLRQQIARETTNAPFLLWLREQPQPQTNSKRRRK